ncbi:hypothetical protein [Gemmobacter caeni]|uniref:hypothetical protein n=1 Tax=Gemmobacter caeni TaxID=589035 RepID=UPI0011A2E35F|nr:hypothetical protein [Gemmobacter caeni]
MTSEISTENTSAPRASTDEDRVVFVRTSKEVTGEPVVSPDGKTKILEITGNPNPSIQSLGRSPRFEAVILEDPFSPAKEPMPVEMDATFELS